MNEITGERLKDVLLGIAGQETEETHDPECPSNLDLLQYLEGDLETTKRAELRRHILSCENCLSEVTGLIEANRENQELLIDAAEVDALEQELTEQAPSTESRSTEDANLPPFERIKELLGGFTEFSKRWERRLAFSAVGLAIVLVVGAIWFGTQISGLQRDISAIESARNAEIIRLQEEVAALQNAISNSDETLSTLSDQLAQQTGGGIFEGADEESFVEITVERDLTGPLRIYDRVQTRVVFEGVVQAGSIITQFGQRFEISWDEGDGQDALSLRGWEKVLRSEKGVKFESEPIDTFEAQAADGRLIIRFP